MRRTGTRTSSHALSPPPHLRKRPVIFCNQPTRQTPRYHCTQYWNECKLTRPFAIAARALYVPTPTHNLLTQTASVRVLPNTDVITFANIRATNTSTSSRPVYLADNCVIYSQEHCVSNSHEQSVCGYICSYSTVKTNNSSIRRNYFLQVIFERQIQTMMRLSEESIIFIAAAHSIKTAIKRLQHCEVLDASVEGVDRDFLASIDADGHESIHRFFLTSLSRLLPHFAPLYDAALFECDEGLHVMPIRAGVGDNSESFAYRSQV